MVGLDDGTWDPANAMFCDDYSRSSGWTFFDVMTENSIETYDAMELTWEPIRGRRPHFPSSPNVVLGELTTTLPTFLVVGKELCDSIGFFID